MKDNIDFANSIKRDNYIFKIGEVSKMTGISPRQLRYWEQKGYIHSERSEKMSSRVFNHENFIMVKLIKSYLNKDIPLALAVQKAREYMQIVKTTYAFIVKMHHGLVEVDGRTMLDMGYFNEEHTKRLYGYLNDQQQVRYVVKDIKKDA